MSKKTYSLLQDESWLEEHYLIQRLTLTEIALLVGCSTTAVRTALKGTEIPIRTSGESRQVRGSRKGSRIAELRDYDWLHSKYVDELLSTDDIGLLLGCSGPLVWRSLRAHGIETRKPGMIRDGKMREDARPELQDYTWLHESYIIQGRSKEDIARELDCKPETVQKWLYRNKIRRKEPLPRGEALDGAIPRTRSKDGYIVVWSPNHPFRNKTGFVPEHRLEVEKGLGRYLTASEVVHHINERRDDNRLDNLMVFPNNRLHTSFHENPPSWVPRCECCGKSRPELLDKRPDHIALYFKPDT